MDLMGQPKTAWEALEKWDEGAIIRTVELGGEQTIHIGIFELLRSIKCEKVKDKILKEMDDKKNEVYGGRTIDTLLGKVNDEFDLQLSGGQAGAIISFTLMIIRDGWQETISKYKGDRIIQVTKNWPCSHK